MDIETKAKNELIDKIRSILVTPNLRKTEYSEKDESLYKDFIFKVTKKLNSKRDVALSVELPLDFASRKEMFDLIKSKKVFIVSSVKFKTLFTTKEPELSITDHYTAKFTGNEFDYSFLDNHPGILNVDRLKDIPIDYEGLMAVPPTILEYKHLKRFNIHRVIYNPIHNGKQVYTRVVISNKVAVADWAIGGYTWTQLSDLN